MDTTKVVSILILVALLIYLPDPVVVGIGNVGQAEEDAAFDCGRE